MSPAAFPADILVVDDTPQNVVLLSRMLRACGHRVRGAISGGAGLRAATSAVPDLVMLDVMMPDLDGYEVCRRLKQDPLTRDVPVIFISALDAVLDKVQAFGVGGADYVTKPFQAEELVSRIDKELALSRLMKDLAAKNAELRAVNEEKDRLLGMAAHDLRSPLTVILAYAEYLGMHGAARDADEKEVLGAITGSAQHMVRLVDDLLDIAKIEAGRVDLQVAPTDLPGLVAAVLGHERRLAQRKQIQLQLVDEGTVPVVSLDRTRVVQVLTNLVGNAVKFSAAGSVVAVRVRGDGAAAVVSVHNPGPEIPEAERERLFQLFGRTSVQPTAGESSSGLGLAIARRLVEAHGGRIWLEDGAEAGTTFSFSLPLAAPGSHA